MRRPGQRGPQIKADPARPALECRDWTSSSLFWEWLAEPRSTSTRVGRLPNREVKGFQPCRDVDECESALTASADVLMDGYFQDDPDVDAR